MKKSEPKSEIFDYVSPTFEAFICPITDIVMKDPYMDSLGISYEKLAVQEWVKKTGRHPIVDR